MGWYTLLVSKPGHTGNGYNLTIWGWDIGDARNRARAAGYLVHGIGHPSTSTTTNR